jgi:hypothetical protein
MPGLEFAGLWAERAWEGGRFTFVSRGVTLWKPTLSVPSSSLDERMGDLELLERNFRFARRIDRLSRHEA